MKILILFFRPLKKKKKGKLTEESRGASISLPKFAEGSPARDRIIRNSQSDISLNQDLLRAGTNGYGNTWLVSLFFIHFLWNTCY